MSKHVFILLALLVIGINITLVATLFPAFLDAAPLGQAPVPVSPELVAAVETALTQRLGAAPPNGVVVSALSEEDGWLFGTAGVRAPVVEDASPEGYLFLAQETAAGWQVALEYSLMFDTWSAQAPWGLMPSAPIGMMGEEGVAQDDPRLTLPWALGETWVLSGGPHSNDGSGVRPWSSLDFARGSGQVRAARDGIAYLDCANFVRLNHADGWQTGYYHLTNVQVQNGDWVTRGQLLGYSSTAVGCGGYATGPHQHFSLRRYGVKQEVGGQIIGGWRVLEGSSQYGGCMIKDGQTRCAPSGQIRHDGTIGHDTPTPTATPVTPSPTPEPPGATPPEATATPGATLPPLASPTATVTPGGIDQSPPTIRWVVPTGDGQQKVVGGEPISLRVEASDDVGVARVVFYRWDARSLRYIELATLSESPYWVTLDGQTLNAEWNEISARAYDGAGRESERRWIWLFREMQPDLLPHPVPGQAHPVVPSALSGTAAPGVLYAGQPTFFDVRFINSGAGPANGSFFAELWLDEQRIWRAPFHDQAPTVVAGVDDWAVTVVTPGWHRVRLVIDPEQNVADANRGNNVWEQAWYWLPSQQGAIYLPLVVRAGRGGFPAPTSTPTMGVPTIPVPTMTRVARGFHAEIQGPQPTPSGEEAAPPPPPVGGVSVGAAGPGVGAMGVSEATGPGVGAMGAPPSAPGLRAPTATWVPWGVALPHATAVSTQPPALPTRTPTVLDTRGPQATVPAAPSVVTKEMPDGRWATATGTASLGGSPVPSMTATPLPWATQPLASMTPQPSETPPAAETPTPAQTAVLPQSPTGTPTQTAVPTETPAPTHTEMPAPTQTAVPPETPTPLPTATVAPTETALATETPLAAVWEGEAEAARVVAGGVVQVMEAQGCGYLAMLGEAPSEGEATVMALLPRAGDYILWVHLQGGAEGGGALRVSLDDGAEGVAAGGAEGAGGGWRWAQARDMGGQPLVFSGAPGEHQLRLRLPPGGLLVDRLVLTTDWQAGPPPAGACLP